MWYISNMANLLIPPYNAGDTSVPASGGSGGTGYRPERLHLSDEESSDLGDIKKKMDDSYTMRQQEWQEFNDMSYSLYYDGNMRGKLSYIPPKLNEQDVRVVTGTTEEKKNTVVALVLNYNLQPDIEAFDKDDIVIQELGTLSEDMIKKSRHLETPKFDEQLPQIYDEFFSQGNVFLEESWQEVSILKKVFKDDEWKKDMNPNKMKWEEKMETKGYCNLNMVSGLDVYPGNPREFFMELQPHLATRREIPWGQAQALYGDWERFKYIPKYNTKVRDDDEDIRYHNWYQMETVMPMVEEIKFQGKWDNRYQILLNGVPMLPPGFPLSYLTGMSEYTILKGDAEPISRFFFWSKGIPSKTKVDQAILDEFIKSMILKTRKSYNPPYVNNTGIMLSKKVFFPGNIATGIDTTKLVPLEKDKVEGITNAEFAAFEAVKRMIDEKTVNPALQGQSTKGKKTAKEVIELKQQSLQKLGLPLFGVLNLHKKMAWARLHNIMNNWTVPLDINVEKVRGGMKATPTYRSLTIDSQFEDGRKGKRVIEFSDSKSMPHPNQVNAESALLENKYGEPVLKSYIDAERLRTEEISWFIEIKPTEKETSELKAAMFTEHITQAKKLWPNQVNDEYVKERWARHVDENPDKFFIKQNPQQQQRNLMGQQGQNQEPQGNGGTPLNDGMQAKGPTKPSAQALLNA